jgi:hypothetical protein
MSFREFLALEEQYYKVFLHCHIRSSRVCVGCEYCNEYHHVIENLEDKSV